MEHYELLAIFPGTMTEEESGAVRTKITELITKNGGAITLENALGLRKLSYPVKHHRQGLYHLIEFNAEPSRVQEINRALHLDADVLRFLAIHKREKTEEELVREQAMAEKMKAKHAERRAREERETSARSASAKPMNQGVQSQAPASPEHASQTPASATQPTTSPETEPKTPPTQEQREESKVNLDDLNKRLDEILDDSDIKL